MPRRKISCVKIYGYSFLVYWIINIIELNQSCQTFTFRNRLWSRSTFINWHMNFGIDEDHKTTEHMCPPLEGKCSRFIVFIYVSDEVPALFDYEPCKLPVLSTLITIAWFYIVTHTVFELWVRKMNSSKPKLFNMNVILLPVIIYFSHNPCLFMKIIIFIHFCQIF